MLWRLMIITLVTVTAVQAKQPLTVLYDNGQTASIGPYLPKQAPRQTESAKQTAKQHQLPFTLPISTPSMTVGTVSTTPLSLRYLQQPIFLVGADAFSKTWLQEKREYLLAIGAVGLLIEAQDLAAIEAMALIADGLRLVPASAEGFASRLGLTHYPILLSKAGWEQ